MHNVLQTVKHAKILMCNIKSDKNESATRTVIRILEIQYQNGFANEHIVW